MHRSNRPLQSPTFAQTVVLIQTLPEADRQDLDVIKRQHLRQGFHYDPDQIHRALRALTDRARPWHHSTRSNRVSGRST
jgi:hypothetical protein